MDVGPGSKSWDRFCGRHLGSWTGRALAVRPDGSLAHAVSYTAKTESLSPSKTNPDFVLVTLQVNAGESGVPENVVLRYNAAELWVFEDGSYTTDLRLVDLGSLLPREGAVAFAIEHALCLSATERARALVLYDGDGALEAVLFLEETREGLFEQREPLAFTSLLGEWEGQSETMPHMDAAASFRGFGPRARSEPERRRLDYSEDDLPDELKHPSGKDDLLRSKTCVSYGWEPQSNSVRRTTTLSDMQGEKLGSSTIYGAVSVEGGSLFDAIKFSDNTVLFTLSNGCYVAAPLARARGVAANSELACHITPSTRRRCTRTYSAKGLASESLVTESLGRQ